ncbi:MAG TPA: hypothetical protein VGU46_00195 [Acidobacteriaceae bacterium]|nr:hypothetical protein [Acidobacteriaceae bacterium]
MNEQEMFELKRRVATLEQQQSQRDMNELRRRIAALEKHYEIATDRSEEGTGV